MPTHVRDFLLPDGRRARCHFDLDMGARDTREDPGYAPSIVLEACVIDDNDILELLPAADVTKLEEQAMDDIGRMLAASDEADYKAYLAEKLEEAKWEL